MAEGMQGLPVAIPLGNNGGYNGDGWGNAGGAFIGGAIGGAVGSAWNGNRWNVGGGNCGSGCGCGSHDSLYLMDSLTTLRSDVNSSGRDGLVQTAGVQSALCQGFSGVNASVERVGAALAQSQSRTEAAVLTTGLQGQIQQKDNTIFGLQASHSAEIQGMRNTFELASKIDGCCCETNRNIERQGCETRAAIHAEGEATRALINKYAYEALQTQLCDAKAENAALKSQQFSSALAANGQQQIRSDMNSMLNTILTHMQLRTTTGTGTGTGAAA